MRRRPSGECRERRRNPVEGSKKVWRLVFQPAYSRSRFAWERAEKWIRLCRRRLERTPQAREAEEAEGNPRNRVSRSIPGNPRADFVCPQRRIGYRDRYERDGRYCLGRAKNDRLRQTHFPWLLMKTMLSSSPMSPSWDWMRLRNWRRRHLESKMTRKTFEFGIS